MWCSHWKRSTNKHVDGCCSTVEIVESIYCNNLKDGLTQGCVKDVTHSMYDSLTLPVDPHTTASLLLPSECLPITDRTLPIILLDTSPTPTDLTPGCLSRAISLEEVSAFSSTGPT